MQTTDMTVLQSEQTGTWPPSDWPAWKYDQYDARESEHDISCEEFQIIVAMRKAILAGSHFHVLSGPNNVSTGPAVMAQFVSGVIEFPA